MAGTTWIISAYSFREHKSLAAVREELKRLRVQNPRKKFRVYQINSEEVEISLGDVA